MGSSQSWDNRERLINVGRIIVRYGGGGLSMVEQQ